jgi:hypothetical protein
MAWWIAGAVVLVSLLGLAAVGGLLGRRLAELARVADLAGERAARSQTALQASAGPVQATLTGLQESLAGLGQRSGGKRRR